MGIKPDSRVRLYSRGNIYTVIAIIINWLLSALAILVVANVVPGFVINNFTTALIVALVLGILNALVKPILLILTLPVNILTLGLFTFIINAVLIYLASRLVSGFTLSGFGPALIAAILLWLINLAVHLVLFPVKTA